MTPTSKEVINALCKILDATPKKINLFMTPKGKAQELIDKYLNVALLDKYESKQCALIAVDEILMCCIGSHEEYWQEVKQEIEKL